MLNDLLAKWLAHYDPIHRGYTPRGIANAVCATAGWSFPRVGGGYNLYRGSPTPQDIDYSAPVGAAGPGATAVSDFAWSGHAANAEYSYALRAIGGGGVESPPSQPAVSVAFDASGAFLGGRPNPPNDLAVTAASGGRFILRWSYTALGEETPPAEFRIYGDGGTGTVDYTTTVAAVTYRRGQVHFEHTTGSHGDGARRRWSVRAVSAGGRNDGNQTVVEGTAVAVGPETLPNLLGVCVAF